MKMLESADVLIENFKPGTLDKWGIGNDVLREKFPRLVHCRISGFGADGPRGGNPGYDAIIQAMTGMIAATGSPQSGPMRIGVPLVDITTGLYAAIGILMALSERQKSGLGPVSRNHAVRNRPRHHASARRELFHARQAAGPHRQRASQSRALRDLPDPRPTTSSSASAMTAPSASCAKEIGKPELGTDPRFARNKDRIANRDALRAELAAVFSQHDAEPLCDRLLAAGLPAGPVQSIDQALTNAHTMHRGDVIEKDWYKGVASPIRLERTKPSLRRIPPKFSQHAAEVLGEFGYSSGRDRCPGRRGRGLRPRTQALDQASTRGTCQRCAGTVRDTAACSALPGRRGIISAYFPASLGRALPPYHRFRLYGHLHVIQRCYRAKRR